MKSSLTLHEAMAVVLLERGWMPMADVAAAINERGIYSKRDGSAVQPGQIRMRATLSGGRYSHLFETDGQNIRLALMPSS